GVTISIPMVLAMLALGLAAGVLSGMFGIGGGLVIVPALVLGFGLNQKAATGTSLLALLMPVGLLGVMDYWQRREIRPAYGLWIAVGLFFGAYLGARITHQISDRSMKRFYAVFLLVVATYYLVTTSRGPAVPPTPAPEVGGGDQVH
ncbi:MAG TPA: sulfite exporter TauE/SafE family protein, partial [Isosphaeraceae bacterium]